MKFSIGIPAFKAKFLYECINSILQQNFADFELIILNDNSPEDIVSIVKKFTDPRIKYFKNEENIGAENVVDNWNKCLAKSLGEYFILMGDDDKMEPNYLDEFNILINKYPDLDVFHCRSYIIDENSNKTDVTASWPEYESVFENIWHRTQFLRQQYISDFVYKSLPLKAKGGFFKLPLAWSSDDITSYLLMDNKGIAHTNNPVFNYRRNSQTISSNGNSHLKLKAITMEREWLFSFLKEQKANTEIDEIIQQKLISNLTRYFKIKRIKYMCNSYGSKTVFNEFFYWIKNKQQYESNNFEIIYSLIEYIKHKINKSTIS